MDNAEATALAASAARAWGSLAAAPRLVQSRENIVFELRLGDGRHSALRLHRPGYRSREAIRSELAITEALADTGFACPWPHRTTDGDFLHDPGPDLPLASLVQWIDGKPIGGQTHPFHGTPGDQIELYRQLGILLADLHLTADATAPRDHSRTPWDIQALCSPTQPIWGRYWENPALSAENATLLQTARDLAAKRLSKIPQTQCGLIHGDVLQENVLFTDNQLYLIDFDDCGTGYRLYDLATALIQHQASPYLGAIQDALIDGYIAGEGPLPESAFSDLPMFVMLRAMASAGWIIARSERTDPQMATYADRAARLARQFVTQAD